MIEYMFIIFVSCLCMLVYLPLFSQGLMQARQREILQTQWRITSVKVTHFTGTAAIVYGITKTARSIIIVVGGVIAISQESLKPLILAFVMNWVVGQIGLMLARQLQEGESDFEIAPKIPDFMTQGPLAMMFSDEDAPSSEEQRFEVIPYPLDEDDDEEIIEDNE